MAFRIHDVTVHLMIGGAPGACTCGPASPGQERPGCGGASGAGPAGPKPPAKPKPKGPGKPKPPGGDNKRKALGFLRDQLREALAPPTP